MEMFAIASRKKLRFNTTKGEFTSEDLWDLPLTSDNGIPNLDDIAKGLHKAMKEGEEVSFVKSNVATNAAFDTNRAKFDIVKFIIDVKLAEADVAKKAKATREKNQRIMELIAQKDDESLVSKSREELMAMLSEGAE